MSDLIKALQIFLKYSDPRNPTNCSHDEFVVCVEPAVVSEEDRKKLHKLGFHANEEEEHFYSFRFGSC